MYVCKPQDPFDSFVERFNIFEATITALSDMYNTRILDLTLEPYRP
jgi:hypothetical protein